MRAVRVLLLPCAAALAACTTSLGSFPPLPLPPAPAPPAGGATEASPLAATEARIHELVNLRRARAGLPPLEHDARVAALAREHSARMAAGGRLSHDGFAERVAAVRAFLPVAGAAENVAYDARTPLADQLVAGWISSPGHRENIEGAYQVTGVGVVRGRDGAYYATQLFLARR